MTVNSMGELAEHIDQTVRDVLQVSALDACGAVANKSGIGPARANLTVALSAIEDAQHRLRLCQEVELRCSESAREVLAEAEWALADRFTAAKRNSWKAAKTRRQPDVAKATTDLTEAANDVAVARESIALAERRFSAALADLTAAVTLLQTLSAALPERSTR